MRMKELKQLIPNTYKIPYWKIINRLNNYFDNLFIKRYFLEEKKLIFIFGCQRSGTTALGRLFGLSPFIEEYGEGNRIIFNENEKIISHEKLIQLKSESNKPYVVIKPIMHNHEIIFFNSHHNPYKIIWIFRHFEAVVYSMINGHVNVANAIDNQLTEHLNALPSMEKEKYFSIQPTIKYRSPDYYLLYWIVENKIFLESLNQIKSNQNLIVLSYERLTSNYKEIEKLFKTINIPVTRGIKEYYIKSNRETSQKLFHSELLKDAELIYKQLTDLCT